MNGKGKFAKIKSSDCIIPIEAANICIILTRTLDSNWLIALKVKRDLKYRPYVSLCIWTLISTLHYIFLPGLYLGLHYIFLYFIFLLYEHHLRLSINIAMHKIK